MISRRRLLVTVARASVLAAALAGLASSLFADFSGDDWPFFKPVELPAGLSEGSMAEVVPDRQVFANASPGLGDLRLIEVGSQQEVPYKLLVERGEQRRRFISVAMRDLGHVAGQYTSFVVSPGQQGVIHNELEVHTTSQNFQRQVVIEGSADGQTWAVLTEKGRIFDFTVRERAFTARDTRVQYPASTAPFLRVRILNNGEPPLEINGASAYFSQELAPQETEIPAVISQRTEDTQNRKTLMVLDLESLGTPTSRVAIATSQQNFHRLMQLDGSNDNGRWTPVVSSTELYAYNTPKFVGSKLTVTYPESTYRYYRLTIFNEDNPPLPVTGATAYGFLRKLIFAASAGVSYQLYYGNAQARTPSYELERVFPYLVTENLPRAGLRAQTSNPLYAVPSPPPQPFTERYPWLLPSVVAVVALVIGLFLANLLRQIRKVLPPPASS